MTFVVNAAEFITGILLIWLGISMIKNHEDYFSMLVGKIMSESLRKDKFTRFSNWYVLLGFIIGAIGGGIALILMSLSIIQLK